MASIRTVTGDIDTCTLKNTHIQCHEHIFLKYTHASEKHEALSFSVFEKSLEELLTYQRSGGGGLVDAQPVGAGRDEEGLIRLADAIQIPIIASTGFHTSMFYPLDSELFALDADVLADLFMQEICVGMVSRDDITGKYRQLEARAGVIKAALEAERPARFSYCALEAALCTAAATGAPLMVHTEKGSDVIAFLEQAERKHVLLSKIAICHMDRTCADLSIHMEAAQSGAYLEYDTIARPKYHDDGEEIRIIGAMVKHGLAKNILISLDTTRARLASYGGAPGLSYLLKDFIPLLRQYLTEEDIAIITRSNPIRYLENSWNEV